jgi:hypothetical protein
MNKHHQPHILPVPPQAQKPLNTFRPIPPVLPTPPFTSSETPPPPKTTIVHLHPGGRRRKIKVLNTVTSIPTPAELKNSHQELTEILSGGNGTKGDASVPPRYYRRRNLTGVALKPLSVGVTVGGGSERSAASTV